MRPKAMDGKRLLWTVCENPPENIRLIKNPGIEHSYANQPGHVMRVYRDGFDLYVEITNESPPPEPLRGIQVEGEDYRPPRVRHRGLPPGKSIWYRITTLTEAAGD